MAHEDLKEHLYKKSGKYFVAALTKHVYKWAMRVPDQYYEYRIFEELTIRYATGERTRLGLEKNDHYRFDAVFFIKPGYRALNQHQCYTVGMELKNSAEDLKYDEKIQNYLGWTDFFMLGVPENLIGEARQKIENITSKYAEAKEKIGLLCIDTGEILIYPRRQLVSQSNKLEIQEQIIYNCIFRDIKTVNFELDEIDLQPIDLKDEYKDVANTSIENFQEDLAADPAENQAAPDGNISLSSGKKTDLSNEEKSINDKKSIEKQQAKKQRLEHAAKQTERMAVLAERGKELPPSTALLYNKLRTNSKEIFWVIVDTGGECTREKIAEATGMSIPTIDRFIPELKKSGLIDYEGSRKTGKYVVKSDMEQRTSCDTCSVAEGCPFKGSSEGMCSQYQ